jgi:hypothetical protein
MLVGIGFGIRFGITIQRAREFELKNQHEEDFIDFLRGNTIQAQMEKDGWKL